MSTKLPAYTLDPDAVLKQSPADTKWRHSVPSYDKVIALFEKHKITNHSPASLEHIVQNIVKNWEKEVSHIVDPRQWSTVDLDNYSFSCNGQQKYNGWEMIKIGTYNALIGQTSYYDSSGMAFEESHVAFKRSFGEGFAWEVLEVYSGPPTVTFSWRHFGRMTDYFSCRGLSGLVYKVDPTNKMIKLFGMCKVTVNEQYQIQDLQIFYDPNQLFAQLTEISPFAPFSQVNPPEAPRSKAIQQKSNANEHKKRQKSTICNIL